MTEGEYLGRLASLGCIACRLLYDDYEPPDPSLQLTVIHHPRTGQGKAQRASNWIAIPLCVPHHVGKYGTHNNGNSFPELNMSEMDVLAHTIRIYHEQY